MSIKQENPIHERRTTCPTVRALNDQAWDLSFRDPARALELSLESRRQAEATGDDLGLAGSLLNIGVCRYLSGEYRIALQELNKALTLFEEMNDLCGLANALNWLGNVQWRLNEYKCALALHQRSLAIRTERGDIRGQAGSLNNIGLIYYDLSQYDVALDFHLRSLQLYETLSDHDGHAMALNNLANVYSKQGEEETSLEYHLQSLQLKREVGNRVYEAGSLTNIGNAYRRLKDYPRALEYHFLSLEIARELNNLPGEALSLLNLGNVHADLDEPEKALECFRSCLTTFEAVEDRYYEAIARINLAQALDRLNHGDDARAQLHIALQRAEELDSNEMLWQAHEALAAHHEAHGDPARAVAHLRSGFQYREAMHAAAAAQKIKALVIKAEMEKVLQEAEIHRLKHVELSHAYQELQRADKQKTELLEQLRMKSQELERLNGVDVLTGVANRRRLDTCLNQEFERSRRLCAPLTVVMVDVDDFKNINDRCSHLVGDATLQSIARILQGGIRSIDTVGRFGGEEFLLILVETCPRAAIEICERLCQSVRDHDWSQINAGLSRVTISVGFCGDPAAHSPDVLVEAADRRLYQAKRSGKDQICGHDGF